MGNFTQTQYQRVIDRFGAGKIRWIADLPDENVSVNDTNLQFGATLVKTTQGIFCLIEIENDKVVGWWCSEKYLKSIINIYGIKNSRAVSNTLDKLNITVHKFHFRFSLLQI